MSVGGVAGVACFIGIDPAGAPAPDRCRASAPRQRRRHRHPAAAVGAADARPAHHPGFCAAPGRARDGEVHAWAQGIVTLQPGAAALIADVNPIFKLHLFLGMTIFLVFPFTRLVHVWSAPVWYLGRTGYQIVRTKQPVADVGCGDQSLTGGPAS